MLTQPTRARSPLIARRYIVLFFAMAVVWGAAVWVAFEREVQKRTAAAAAQQAAGIRQEAAVITANIDGTFNRLQGLAAVVAGMGEVVTVLEAFGPGAAASPLPYAARKAEWSGRPDLLALSRRMLEIKKDIDVDIVWVMNASGDCVAASNSGEATSFVGTNYIDRSYFASARAGQRGRQFAVGRVTKVPGLFFSAPVTADGRFLGAVAVKSDLPRSLAVLTHAHAFVTDDHGVIILAADRELEMRALPGASVHRLSDEARSSRYQRLAFQTHEIGAESADGVIRMAGAAPARVAVHSALPQHGITLHIVEPVWESDSLRRDVFVAFLLLFFSGLLLTALAFGAAGYVSRVSQQRRRIEETNESLTRLNEQLEQLATVDSLTGLYNRHFMDDWLEREVARAGRKQAPLAVMMIDIDRFKDLNDSFGHAAGDTVLRDAGALMRQHIRASDVVFRYGGEEFLCVLPEAGLEIARERAEALCRAMRELKISHDGRALDQVTISIGLAMFPDHGTLVAELLTASDAALYEAKNRGRDRLVVFEPPDGRVGDFPALDPRGAAPTLPS